MEPGERRKKAAAWPDYACLHAMPSPHRHTQHALTQNCAKVNRSSRKWTAGVFLVLWGSNEEIRQEGIEMMDADVKEHVRMEDWGLFCPQKNGEDIRRVRERFGM